MRKNSPRVDDEFADRVAERPRGRGQVVGIDLGMAMLIDAAGRQIYVQSHIVVDMDIRTCKYGEKDLESFRNYLTTAVSCSI